MSALVQTTSRFGSREMDLLTGAAILDANGQREVLEQLFRSSSAEMRQRAIRCAAAVLPDDVLAGYLRNGEDDVLRNAGLESLKLRARRSFNLAVSLLDDPDHDVVLQAVLIIDVSRNTRGWAHLRPLLQLDDTNIVQAIITAAGHVGGPDAVSDLLPFLGGDPWLQIAAIQALGDLRCPSAVPHLRKLFDDPFAQTFAAEAVTRIGGRASVEALSALWQERRADLDADTYVPLLAQLLKQEPARPNRLLLESVVPHLFARTPATSVGAAWCVIALGPSSHDEDALNVIAACTEGEFEAPPCLRRRTDLVTKLIERDPPLRDLGYGLAATVEGKLEADQLALFLAAYPPSRLDVVEPLAPANMDFLLARVVVDLWLRRREDRDALNDMIRANASAILREADHIRGADRLALLQTIGASGATIVAELAALEPDARWSAASALDDADSVRLLPWPEWLGADRAAAANALALAVSRTRCIELLPLVRAELAAAPTRELITAVAALRDGESAPLLVAILDGDGDRLLRALSFEALGRIGGDVARAELRSRCQRPGDAAAACRALASCAEPPDCELLRNLSGTLDMSVRLAVIPALVAHPDGENREFLRRLLFDPSTAVAQRAHSALDVIGSHA